MFRNLNFSIYFCGAIRGRYLFCVLMKKTLYAISLLVVGMMITSCTKYNIQGSSDLQDIDGRMLYLKDMANEQVVNLDSSDVVHGKFKFDGPLDSVRIVALCIDNNLVMPVVLEDGNINISLNMQTQECKGTPLNDTLNVFNQRYRQLAEQLQNMEHQKYQAVMDGGDIDQLNQDMNAKAEILMQQEDKLVTSFITENFDNCLGPFVFQLATGGYDFPVLTPWIEALMVNATENFRNAPYVKEYMEQATHNRDVMSGMEEPKQMHAAPPTPPTPNELAGAATE